MAHNIRIWSVSSDSLSEISRSKLDIEERLESWIEQDISIISDDFLIIGRQVPTYYNTVIDILCLDRNGDLVVIELKRNKTPRDTVAQVLDYASWVRDLPREQIVDMADSYLQNNGPLEVAFNRKFHENLPDVLNASHSMLVVASEIDASTDRIVQYLSEVYGVGINVVEFQYFQDSEKREYIFRVFLIDPDIAISNTERSRTSKRKPNLTREELAEKAEENGVFELYISLEKNLRDFFDGSRTTQSSLGFEGKNIEDVGRGVIFNLLPLDSSEDAGLKYQVYSHRFAKYFKCSIQDLEDILPQNRNEWSYEPSNKSEMWIGFLGYFYSVQEVEKFLSGLRKFKKINK